MQRCASEVMWQEAEGRQIAELEDGGSAPRRGRRIYGRLREDRRCGYQASRAYHSLCTSSHFDSPLACIIPLCRRPSFIIACFVERSL